MQSDHATPAETASEAFDGCKHGRLPLPYGAGRKRRPEERVRPEGEKTLTEYQYVCTVYAIPELSHRLLQAFFITFDKQYRPEDEEELLEWFAEVVRPKPKESNSSEPKAEELKGAQPEPGERQEQVAKNEELASNGEAAKRGEPAKGIPGHRWGNMPCRPHICSAV